MRPFCRRRTPQQKRDDAINNASDHFLYAVRALKSAHHHAYEMGDTAFATELWRISDEVPAVSRQLDCYIYDWAAVIDGRCPPIVPVQRRGPR